jgi:hypothetical protein
MGKLKEKFEKFDTNELERMFNESSDKEQDCIRSILRHRSILESNNDFYTKPVKSDKTVNHKTVLPTLPKTSKPKIKNTVTPVDNITFINNKQPQFYMVFDVILKEFGFEVALLIALLASKQRYYQQFKKLDAEGCFYLEHPRIQEMTGIGEYSQKKAMAILSELKILYISPKKKGTPPKKYYRVNKERYDELVEKLNTENYD